jgi:hypothetical protein
MSHSSEVLLSSTLHDPRGVFLPTLESAAQVVANNYGGWIINTTVSTDQRVKDQIKSLQGMGVYFSETDPLQPIVEDKVENDHLYLLGRTLILARDLGMSRVQYTDGDRMIMAAKYFPEDFQAMAKRAAAIDERAGYLNFRRSGEDYLAHHAPLLETELEFNRFYSEVFGMPIDISSTSHVMSADILQAVVEKSVRMRSVSFPHPKWLLIAKEMGALISSEETNNVLTFETPEQFRAEVEQKKELENGFNKVIITPEGIRQSPGQIDDIRVDYSILQQLYMQTFGLASILSSSEWQLRFTTAKQYLEVLQDSLGIFGFNDDHREEINRRISDKLNYLERYRLVILCALPQT